MKVVPPQLTGIYDDCYKKIKNDLSRNHDLAKRTICMILGAEVQLRTAEFIKAVNEQYEDCRIEDILFSCHSLVIHNESTDTFELGHFSVAEYIRGNRNEDFDSATVHDVIANLCLSVVITNARTQTFPHMKKPAVVRNAFSRGFYRCNTIDEYAIKYWAYHCQQSGSDSLEASSKTWQSTLAAWLGPSDADTRWEWNNRSARHSKDLPRTSKSLDWRVAGNGAIDKDILALGHRQALFMIGCKS